MAQWHEQIRLCRTSKAMRSKIANKKTAALNGTANLTSAQLISFATARRALVAS